MSKKGKKQDGNDDSFEPYVKDYLETIRQDVETIKYHQAKFKEDLKSFEQKLERTTESLNLKLDTLNGEVHVAMTRVDKLEDEVSKLATNVNQAYKRLLSLERCSRDLNLRFYNIPEESNENCIEKFNTILSNDLGIKPVRPRIGLEDPGLALQMTLTCQVSLYTGKSLGNPQ